MSGSRLATNSSRCANPLRISLQRFSIIRLFQATGPLEPFVGLRARQRLWCSLHPAWDSQFVDRLVTELIQLVYTDRPTVHNTTALQLRRETQKTGAQLL